MYDKEFPPLCRPANQTTTVEANVEHEAELNEYYINPLMVPRVSFETYQELRQKVIQGLTIYEVFPFMKTYEEDYERYVEKHGKEKADKLIATFRDCEQTWKRSQEKKERLKREREELNQRLDRLADSFRHFGFVSDSGIWK